MAGPQGGVGRGSASNPFVVDRATQNQVPRGSGVPSLERASQGPTHCQGSGRSIQCRLPPWAGRSMVLEVLMMVQALKTWAGEKVSMGASSQEKSLVTVV